MTHIPIILYIWFVMGLVIAATIPSREMSSRHQFGFFAFCIVMGPPVLVAMTMVRIVRAISV